MGCFWSIALYQYVLVSGIGYVLVTGVFSLVVQLYIVLLTHCIVSPSNSMCFLFQGAARRDDQTWGLSRFQPDPLRTIESCRARRESAVKDQHVEIKAFCQRVRRISRGSVLCWVKHAHVCVIKRKESAGNALHMMLLTRCTQEYDITRTFLNRLRF